MLQNRMEIKAKNDDIIPSTSNIGETVGAHRI